MININHYSVQFSSVQSLSCVQLFATPWTAAHQASLPFIISQSWLKLMFIKSMMPSSHLILCHPLLLLPPIPPSIRVFSNESTFRMRCPKYWSFSFSIIPSKEHTGLISFRMDWLEKFKSKPQWGIISCWSEWLPSKSLQTINAGESMEKRKPSYTVGWNANWYNHYGEQCGDSLKNWE